MLESRTVAIAAGKGAGEYPATAPFHPHEAYPELGKGVGVGKEHNPVYPLVRELWQQMQLDQRNFGSEDWNPLGEFVRPGDKVVIKPNLVRHFHADGGNFQAVVTHASVVRAIADYVALALQGRGQIVIGDAPIQRTDFSLVVERTGLRSVCDAVAATWKLPVRLSDFRLWALDDTPSSWATRKGEALKGDQDGYRAVDLGRRSMLSELEGGTGRFRVTCYNADTMRKHHSETHHEYLVAGAVLSADVVINVPKLKTHQKVGLTAAMKNLVGINGHKDWLPHHRMGSVLEGGDEYRYPFLPKKLLTRLDEEVYRRPGAWSNRVRLLGMRALARWNRHFAPDPYREGSWYGNDTCWRMVHDLNRLLLYADRNGEMTDTLQRRVLTVVDAIVAGEGNGPMRPDARKCNLLVGGHNPVAVDAVLATMIGFDVAKLPLIARAIDVDAWPLAKFTLNEIQTRTNDQRFAHLQVGQPFLALNFRAPKSWIGHVEFEVPTSVDEAGESDRMANQVTRSSG